MLGLYYRIWTDCIRRGKSQPANTGTWKTGSLVLMTTSMSMNLLLFFAILERHILHTNFYKFEIPGISNYINNILNLIFLFVLPCFLVNLLLIFRNSRYKILLKKYPYYNGKLFITYFIISLLLPVVLLWGAIVFNKINI